MNLRLRPRTWLSVWAVLASGASLVAACVGDDPILAGGEDASSPATDSATAVDSSVSPGTDAGLDSATLDVNVPDTADAAKTFCDSQVAPVGFTDFFCADFDGPGPVEQGFTTKNLSNGGTITKTTAVAFSDPASMVTSAFGPNRVGSLTWRKTGAANFTQATATARINPDLLGGVAPSNTGTVKLLEIKTSNALVALRYTAGATIDGRASYTGYFFEAAAFGTAAARTEKIIPTGLATSTWTNVKLTWASTGAVSVSYNDVAIFTDNTFGSTDSALAFMVGAEGTGTTGPVGPYRFDNVAFAVRR